MSRLLAIDPGLDEVGWAVFDTGGLTRTLSWVHAHERLLGHGTWYNRATSLPLAPRLAQHAAFVRALAADYGAGAGAQAVLERQITAVRYRDRRRSSTDEAKQASSLQEQQLATGVLAGVLYALEVRVAFGRPADAGLRTPGMLRSLFPALGITSEHCRAALALGLGYLGDARHFTRRAAPALTRT